MDMSMNISVDTSISCNLGISLAIGCYGGFVEKWLPRSLVVFNQPPNCQAVIDCGVAMMIGGSRRKLLKFSGPSMPPLFGFGLLDGKVIFS